ncbi:hypothetical protein M406DRAFT_356454 [Cryphonectria parasitica EP155]|uniref:Uncharacterized protein n=1 Tax=Cryphonectria parasitica (strain ATCC 38755 / EP155) TaxID=660469 RepID=A0A9P4Y090_CRYP1|nr:uncharacterized protein M406DRAFT_356454 [Cryphonectria parasitica EP155]KAF3764176.1 hypothetical protein M406DRAFT_356454 [Cryphonectria parasitica EP155]
MQLPTSFLAAAVMLGFTSMTDAVCSGNVYAIGTPQVLSTGNTQWNIYDTSCNVYQSYQQSSAVSVCDSAAFYCTFGTTLIDQYDDPKSGWAYNCSADATSETCGTDTIIDCCFPFWGQIPNANPEES